MFKRLISLLCILVLCFSCAAAEEEQPEAQRYEFDLTFSLDPEAFPPRSRSRIRGYAELMDRLELKGDIVICEATQSFDMSAALFFRDKPEVSIPFRFYGIPSLLFLTSPVIGNETLLFNMVGLAEFAIKIRKTLDTPLPALALLYPVVYEHNLWTFRDAFRRFTGPADTSREISTEQLSGLFDAWMDLIENDTNLNVWMTALNYVTTAPEAVETELRSIPYYLRDFVSVGEPLTVEVGDGTEVWQNVTGATLFSRKSSEGSEVWSLTLPADENRYAPTLSYSGAETDGSFSFTLDGSMIRQKIALPPGFSEEDFSPLTGGDEEGEYGEYEDSVYPITGGDEDGESGEYDDGGYPVTGSAEEFEEDGQWPETILLVSASGSSIPTSLPCDSAFSVDASVKGALYPNFNLSIAGKTEKDGAVSVSFSLPQKDASPGAMLSLAGTVVRSAVPVETAPDYNYTPDKLYGTYNFFSFSEYYVAKFKNAVTEPLVKGMLDFIAEAPTSAVQAFLDDLTDSGVLGMMMDQ